MIEGSRPQKPEFTHVDAVVGLGTTPEAVSRNIDVVNYEAQYRKNLLLPGREKSETDQSMIAFVQEKADKMLSAYGRKKLRTIPSESIRIVRTSNFESKKNYYSNVRDELHVVREANQWVQMIVLFHEIIHAKAYSALQMIDDEENEVSVYRQGAAVKSRRSNELYFNWLNEAVVQELTIRFYEDEIQPHIGNDESKKEVEAAVYGNREKERRMYTNLAQSLYDAHSEIVSQEEIKSIIFDCAVNGNYMKLGKLIEKTFGKKSLRQIGLHGPDAYVKKDT